MSHSPATTLGRHLLQVVQRRLNAEPLSNRADAVLRADGGEGADTEDTDDHLRDVPDGAGCTEIWEYLSEREASEARDDD
jgi:hypothetical protein